LAWARSPLAVILLLTDLYSLCEADYKMTSIGKLYSVAAHWVAKATKRYYFEDYVRVYPDGVSLDRSGRRKKPKRKYINNFLSHCKIYKFAAQFVRDKRVADIGCGSGYGCEILKNAGATFVSGSDISKHAIEFCRSHYCDIGEFILQGITDLNQYSEDSFDISISSEVLEHIKEYGMVQPAIKELKRITKNEGLIVIGTPNSEMLGDHGFSFTEIQTILQDNFSQFCLVENAFIPSGDKKPLWEQRLSEGDVGVIISEHINLSETVLGECENPEIKKGLIPGTLKFATYEVDTTLLHNTHSWIILAVNNKEQKT
jgi:2-polyprenyl-3-methyl-5-hydroxy-6-metoxy-1,4-benzoquinol methylase